MALGVDPKGAIGNALVGEGGAYNPFGVCRRGDSRRAYLVNDGHPPKEEGGVSGYSVGVSGLGGIRGGAEFKTEEGYGDA